MNTLNSSIIERYSHFIPISSINSLLICQVQIQQPDKTYRIGSYSYCENVIKGILWLVDSVNGEIAGSAIWLCKFTKNYSPKNVSSVILGLYLL